MEYERIHKIQTGLMSPSKLRMKLMGPHHNRKQDSSNCTSSRTSPSKLEENEFSKSSLLISQIAHFDDEAPGLEVSTIALKPNVERLPRIQGPEMCAQPKEMVSAENRDVNRDNLDYDSNASTSSFEFHRERSRHNIFTKSFARPMPSKWNDAEKWIISKQIVQPNLPKKSSLPEQANRMLQTNMGRVAPESTNHGIKSQVVAGKFPSTFHPVSEDSKDFSTESSEEDNTVVSVAATRSVCMRDMGTEMTPIASQEPSRTATPLDAATPHLSPSCSSPSTPQRGGPPHPAPPVEQRRYECGQADGELSQQELKVKTRREILALGLKLGKMNIAAWASKAELEKIASSPKASLDEARRIEFDKRADAWEDAEKSKHAARYMREESKIQAWELQQKAKLEAEMQKLAVKVAQMRSQTETKMASKIALAKKRSEEKRASAETRKNADAKRTAAQADYIRHTGRLPLSYYMCYGCFW